jgi:hypothetical protein
MKLLRLILILALIPAACGKSSSPPAGILSQKDMQEIIRDLMRADVFVSDFVIRKDSSLKESTEALKYYNIIFSMHGIDREGFRKSFTYYKDHPVLFNAIMDSINHQVAPVIYPHLKHLATEEE